MIQILYKDEVVAEQINETTVRRIRHDLPAPIELFQFEDERGIATVMEWCLNRSFPEERIDLEDELKKCGLTRYNKFEIMKFYGGRMAGDEYGVRLTN